MRRIIVEASMLPIWLTYRAWGHRWIDDDLCRRIVTAIMKLTLWIIGAAPSAVPGAPRGGQGC